MTYNNEETARDFGATKSAPSSPTIGGGGSHRLFSYNFWKSSRWTNIGIILQDDDVGNICVAEVYEGGLAAASGLQAGDIIKEINSLSMVRRKSNVAAYVLQNAPEGDVNIIATSFHEQLREGSKLSLLFQVDKPQSKKAVVGISLRNNDDGNIFVTKVNKDGLAAASGIRVNDIIQEINGVSMLKKDSGFAASTITEAIGKITILVARPVVGGTKVNALTPPQFEKAPPPGVESGGIWGTVEYFGPMTVF